MKRVIAAGGGPVRRMTRHSARNGHVRIEAATAIIVTRITRNDDITAKPAPGPM